nr:hypothetical protein [Tanacetum cinerariifolium]
MVAILEKSEHNVDFHPIVDFVEASPLMRNLKLKDEEGISSLPDAELFENLTLMGYNISPNKKFTFQKGQFSHQWKYLIHTIMQCLSPKSIGFNESVAILPLLLIVPFFDTMLVPQGEGSGTPTEPHHTPSPETQHTSPTTHSLPTLPPVTTALFPLLPHLIHPPLRQYTRRAMIAQSSALPPVADEPASPLRDVSQGEACRTVSSLDAKQDRVNIAKTSTLPHESTSRVPSFAADEDSLQLQIQELTDLCTSLQRQQSDLVSKFEAQEVEITMLKARVKLLEDGEGGGADRSGDDAPIKRRRLDKGEEAAKKGSNDIKEMINVLTSMDAATVLSSGVAEVPTGSGSIPTAGPPAAEVPTGSDVVPTAGLIFATATVMARQLEEEMEREAQRMNEQIDRDAEIARIHAEEELQIMIDGLYRSNETVAKYLQEYHQFATELPIERRMELISDLVSNQRSHWLEDKGLQGDVVRINRTKFNTVWKQIEDFIPIGSKEETERFKRKGLRLE